MSTLLDTEVEQEEVVLLSDQGEVIGSLPKVLTHHKATPLHLAFSLFLFDGKGRFLVQRRALHKVTWPGVWTNSCCGHPAPGESMAAAVYRRTQYELGVEFEDLQCVLPLFRYRACCDGIWENEVCPVWIAKIAGEPDGINTEEVDSVAWESWDDFAASCEVPEGTRFADYSPWSLLEARELRRCVGLRDAFAKWGIETK